jgi:hypothetical protein
MTDQQPIANGPVYVFTDDQGWHVARDASRVLCATRDLNAAKLIVADHVDRNPGVEVVGSW